MQGLWKFDPKSNSVDLVVGGRPERPISIRPLVSVRNHIYFARYISSSHRPVVWISEGDPASTRPLMQDHRLSSGLADDFVPQHLGVYDNGLYFVYDDGVHGYELWRSDGTAAGTHMVKDVHPPEVHMGTTFPVADMGDFALFRATSTVGPGEWWRTDGTEANTRRIEVDGLDVDAFSGTPVVLDRVALFVGNTEDHGAELWRTDGTPAGSWLVRDIFPGPADSRPRDLVRFGALAIFQADDDVHGRELWVSDGTHDGTRMIKELAPGARSGDPAPFRVSGGKVFFPAEDPRHGRELWVSDGTQRGTYLLHDLFPGSSGSSPYSITPFRNGVLFSGDHPEVGEELWFSDGTSSGTRLVRDIYPGRASSEPYHLAVLDDIAYFDANDGVHGGELWRSDGTADGTYLVVDLALPLQAPPSSDATMLAATQEHLYFVARDGEGVWRLGRYGGDSDDVSYSAEPRSDRRADFVSMHVSGDSAFLAFGRDGAALDIWRWDDGSVDDAKRISGARAFAADDARAGGARFVSVQIDSMVTAGVDFESGCEVWRVLGSNRDDRVVYDVNPGAADSNPADFVDWNGHTFFTAENAVNGRELFCLTGESVRIVRDIASGATGSSPRALTASDNGLYFVADDGEQGPELWFSDGSDQGTTLVRDVNPIQHSDAHAPLWLTVMGDALYFTADDEIHGCELWKTRGQPETTELVADLFIGRTSSSPEELTVAGNRIYFRADVPDKGIELFVTDGTEAGTRLVRDLVAGIGGARPQHLTPYGGGIFFSARSQIDRSPLTTPGLWWSDTTETKEVALGLGTRGDYPTDLTLFRGQVHFVSNDRIVGRELWRGAPSEDGGALEAELVADLLSPGRPVIPTR